MYVGRDFYYFNVCRFQVFIPHTSHNLYRPVGTTRTRRPALLYLAVARAITNFGIIQVLMRRGQALDIF